MDYNPFIFDSINKFSSSIKLLYIKNIFNKLKVLSSKITFLNISLVTLNNMISFSNIIYSILIYNNIVKSNIFFKMKQLNRRQRLSKKTKIDNLIIANTAITNFNIEQRIITKQITLKMLSFYRKLFLLKYKDDTLYIRRYFINSFDYWKGIINEEKHKVIEEIDNNKAKSLYLKDKLSNYNSKCNNFEDYNKSLSKTIRECKTCSSINNNKDIFNLTGNDLTITFTTAIKDETLNQINLIPEFHCHNLKEKMYLF